MTNKPHMISPVQNLRKRNVRTETAIIAYMLWVYGLSIIAIVALSTTTQHAHRYTYPLGIA